MKPEDFVQFDVWLRLLTEDGNSAPREAMTRVCDARKYGSEAALTTAIEDLALVCYIDGLMDMGWDLFQDATDPVTEERDHG